MRFVIIPVDGRSWTFENPNKKPPSLKQLQQLVGGYIELVELSDCSVYINEDGIAKDLPFNPVADLFVRYRLKADGRKLLGEIRGQVVVMGLSDDDGNETACPPNVVAALCPDV